MRIIRPINNNIVSARDSDGAEVIVVGKGIGFRAKEGSPIPDKKIQKIYRMSSQNETDRLKDLFASLPPEYIQLTDEIFTFAKEMLRKGLNESAYITLADHIHFSIQRYREGMGFQNALHSEIRRFYPTEYAIGKHALDLIDNHLGVRLPRDEAASIAMHLLNAEYDISVSETYAATKLMDGMLDIVASYTGHRVSEDEGYYGGRFITHLIYLAQRVLKNEGLPPGDDALYEMLAAQYPSDIACGKAVATFIEREHGYPVSNEETATLAIHLRHLRMEREAPPPQR